MTEGSQDTETVGEVLRFAGAIAPLAPGTLVAGRFAIVRRLGSGGSSIVYEANDLKLGAPVALKILRADRATPAALKRLHREAKIAREAQDPRLVRVWDIGESSEGAFISMELVDGESLRDAIARGPLPIADAVRIGIEVLAALERLHALGIVHRDLKPSNVLLTPEGRVKLVDFGLARHWERDESRATQADALVGTVEYLSPEQALGKPLDARTDLYSFGILLFEMLTGSLPFTSESTLGAVLAHLNERAPDVCRLRPDARPWLGRLVSRLLEKRPGDRYRSASDALADLRRGRASIAFRRRTWLAAFLVVVLVALVVSAWHLRKPRFASIGRSGNGLQAVDGRGRLLWTWPDARSLAAVLRRDGEPAFVAVVDIAAKDVFLLDPATGRNVRTIGVPDPSVYFPGYARDFTAVPSAFDVDRDGRDELVLDVMHRYYPYAGVLIYPFEGTAQVVFVASGGHSAVATAKLGGEAGDALLFGGVNNRMGWYGSLAAIRIRSKDEEADLSVVLPAATPDRDSGYNNAEDLLWYELGPQGWLNRSKAKVDYARREILIALTDGRVVKLDFDGFLKGTKSSLPRMERLAARRRAFELERASRRSMALENIDEALRANRAARSLAAAAGSPYLVEWLDRAHAIALLRKGRVAEAEVAFEALAKSGSAPGDICWDAARAFHLRGDRGRALDWYERGLASSGQVGRLKTDFVEAGIIAALEMDAFDRARSLVERGLSAHPGAGGPAYYLSFIDWRENGRAPVPPRPGNRPGDFLRATYFELRNASGADPAELLAEMDTTGPFSELDPLWKSLRADLLRRSGRPAEAAALARAALNEARARSADDPVVRYFVPLIQERFEAARTSGGPRPAK